MNTRVREGRTALAITVLLIATLTVPVLLFGNASGFAQTGQSPSPSGTAPQIELLNPSTHSNVVSDKDSDPSSATDPTDTQYHFVAWARNIPANALAEFFIIQGDKNFLLGSSTLKGSDTFDVFASIPDGLDETTFDAQGAPSGGTGGTVRVVLYANNGANEVDRDEQAVVINQKEPPSDTLMLGPANPANAAETIEMTYPPLAGPMGFFTQQGQQPQGVVETTTSSGTDNVAVFYTISAVGTEPTWTDCNSTDETRANSADGTRCTLASGTRPEQVTGMAVVAMDQESDTAAPQGQNTESEKNAGDAHRVAGFEQVPASVFVTSHTSPTGACSPIVTVTVRDNVGREVVNAQVDVHAQGPTDNLWFSTDDTDTDKTDEPDSNDPPENHTTEAGRDCSDLGFGGTQGDHEVGGGPDRKHIESTSRTDDNGEFTYEMYSETAGGTTMLAWVDKDDDDRYCATERSGTGTITWGSGGPAAPNPEGPELETCQASPSGSASTSGSTSSTTTSSSTSPSTTSPTGSASSTSPTSSASTATPTGSASSTTPTGGGTTGSTTGGGTTGTTGSVQQATVDVTLEASQPRKTFGKSFTLSGSVTSTNSACTDFVNVRILRDVVGGTDEFELFAQEQTDANGAFSVTSKAERSANYIAQVTENATCDDASSSPQPVLVRVKVSLRLSKNSVNPGARVRFKITTAPCPATARDKVLLFRAIQGEFGKSGSARSNGSCTATIVRRINRSAVFQARWPKQSPEFLAGKSRSKAVRVDG